MSRRQILKISSGTVMCLDLLGPEAMIWMMKGLLTVSVQLTRTPQQA